jgi:hypothetical protein
MHAMALEAGHLLDGGVAGQLGLDLDMDRAAAAGAPAVVGEFERAITRVVVGDRAKAGVERNRTGAGDVSRAIADAVDAAQEGGVQRGDGARPRAASTLRRPRRPPERPQVRPLQPAGRRRGRQS